ncbi:hypothetical protein IU443_17265 [Nocardia farcinica]|uniref:Uncharacterized protein n=1 Tax=Nocardia farcinica TaxID=37329 RepID=A0A0H5PN50_NOCFR|nr:MULTISPECIES: hypothetical protein [Nocardia]AXK88410.1 hypothetical protein DXT66_24840 [Nocardia farcinica]MBF6071445.1 hypothetical protein [Nocardia farcinica]MBF6141909.1 hypothetical protein [Nocardia farcinica]MBF6185367.1 hypothetical protein [Nocardia farcinica]MBF6250823.1 hypothetical protein [Nocardia farcinica]
MAIQVVAASMMTSDETSHMARCVGGDLWVVSWLPGRTLTGRQAVTAMTIATAVATRDMTGPTEWAGLDELALELGLTGRQAVHLVRLENHDYRGTGDPARIVAE